MKDEKRKNYVLVKVQEIITLSVCFPMDID